MSFTKFDIKVVILDDQTILGVLLKQSIFPEAVIITSVNELFELNLKDYDLFLIDIYLNDVINGIEVAQKIRNLNINTPIIMVSATNKLADSFKSLNIDRSYFVHKSSAHYIEIISDIIQTDIGI